MKIAILHNAVSEDDSAAARDVLVQVEAVEAACQTLGHTTSRLECSLNLEAALQALVDSRPDVVFNLVESLAGSDRLAHLLPALLETLDLPYTGNPATALALSNDKPLVKERLRSAALPTPDWVTLASCQSQRLQPPLIIKAVWEHASIGIDDHSILNDGDGKALPDQLESRSRQLGGECFAEQFISGREFNVSLLEGPQGAELLPPAEIDFSAFPAGKPRIVGYDAKWQAGSFEFDNTPRKFDFPEADASLIERLKTASLQTWLQLGLRGYARVDFRVDEAGQPWILEVNTNPCLSPDAGFAAALAQAGIPFEVAVDRLLKTALVIWDKPHLRPLKGQAALEGPACDIAPLPPAIQTTRSAGSAKPALRPSRIAGVKLRHEVRPADCHAVRRIVESTALFRPGEIDVAVELVQARLEKGSASGYEFVFAQQGRQVTGYVCFGRNSLTVSSFDLYWIAVDKTRQGLGLGRLLLEEAEQHVQAAGGTRIYIETSHRPDYQPTRGFYERCGYRLEAVLEDFYAPGDGRAIYVKLLPPV